MSHLLAGKRALVAGIGPGLGQAIAHRLADHGAEVMVLARSEDRVLALVDEINARGGRAHGCIGDITDVAACSAAAERVDQGMGGLEILVNSAFRMGKPVPFANADLEKWDNVFATNVRGTLNLTQQLLPKLAESGNGRVINIGSMSARRVRSGEGAYAASKAALATLTQTLALELGASGVRVNMVAPGWMWGAPVKTFVEWEMQRRGITEAEVVEEITRTIPLGFIPPQEEVADAVVFFASDLARSITGQILDVNGGEFFG